DGSRFSSTGAGKLRMVLGSMRETVGNTRVMLGACQLPPGSRGRRSATRAHHLESIKRPSAPFGCLRGGDCGTEGRLLCGFLPGRQLADYDEKHRCEKQPEERHADH